MKKSFLKAFFPVLFLSLSASACSILSQNPTLDMLDGIGYEEDDNEETNNDIDFEEIPTRISQYRDYVTNSSYNLPKKFRTTYFDSTSSTDNSILYKKQTTTNVDICYDFESLKGFYKFELDDHINDKITDVYYIWYNNGYLYIKDNDNGITSTECDEADALKAIKESKVFTHSRVIPTKYAYDALLNAYYFLQEIKKLQSFNISEDTEVTKSFKNYKLNKETDVYNSLYTADGVIAAQDPNTSYSLNADIMATVNKGLATNYNIHTDTIIKNIETSKVTAEHNEWHGRCMTNFYFPEMPSIDQVK